ncbi:hypothetical protein HYW17_05300 [Candidatus Uhrbacteria bacterium]|nr:hypothetical protein [Candidatus Uhrbacteria bacterium]
MADDNTSIVRKNKTPETEDLMRDRSIIALLEKLGLSRNEVKCYLASLSLGPANINNVARRAHVHRVNAYGAIKRLVEQGLIVQEGMRASRLIYPAPLENLQALAQGHQKFATKVRWRIEDIIPKLLACAGDQEGTSRVNFEGLMVLRGDEVMERIAERSLDVPAGSTNYYIEATDFFHPANDPDYDEMIYIPERVKRGIKARCLHARELFAARLHERDKKENRETRYLPPDLHFACAVYIYGKEVAFAWKGGEMVGLIVRGGPVFEVMKLLFEMAWQMAGKSREKKKK